MTRIERKQVLGQIANIVDQRITEGAATIMTCDLKDVNISRMVHRGKIIGYGRSISPAARELIREKDNR